MDGMYPMPLILSPRPAPLVSLSTLRNQGLNAGHVNPSKRARIEKTHSLSNHNIHINISPRKETGYLDVLVEGPSSYVAGRGLSDRRNKKCASCRNGSDGSDSILLCSSCPLVFCTTCVELPSQTPGAENSFTCPRCFHRTHQNDSSAPYCDANGNIIKYNNDKDTRKHWVTSDAHPIAVISISLQGEAAGDSCAKATYHYLDSYLFGDAAYVGMDFNFMHPAGRKSFEERMETAMEMFDVGGDLERFERFAVFLTDRSTPDGMLHIGPNNSGCENATKVLEVLFTERFKKILKASKESILFLLSCGAVSMTEDPYKELISFYKKDLFSQMLSFSQHELQVTATSNFIQQFCQNYFTYGKKNVECVLHNHPVLGAHTDVYVFRKSPAPNENMYAHFMWVHDQFQPYGYHIPTQCAQCGTLHPWKCRVRKAAGIKADTPVWHACKNENCSEKRMYRMSEDVTWVHRLAGSGDQRGGWLMARLGVETVTR